MLLVWIKEVVRLKKKNVSSMCETEKYRFAGKLNDTVDELTSRRVDEFVVKSVDIIIKRNFFSFKSFVFVSLFI